MRKPAKSEDSARGSGRPQYGLNDENDPNHIEYDIEEQKSI